MQLDRRRVIAGATALLAGASTATAQSLIKMMVGFPPGGSGDLIARMFSERLKEELGQTIVVENLAGAGGLTAAESFRRQPADGSALMIHTISSAITAPISRKVQPYDSVNDFLWIAVLSVAPLCIAVDPNVPAKDLKTFIEYIRSNPGKLSYGSAGVASSTHLAAELFKDKAGGLDIAHVAYRGSAAAMTDVMSGVLTFYVDPLSTILSQHQEGKLRILAVMDETRMKLAPEVPTTREFGLDAIAGTCNLLCAPIGTPSAIFDPIARATAKVMRREEFRTRLVDLGIEPILDSNQEKTKAFVAAEIARWTPIVRKLGIAL